MRPPPTPVDTTMQRALATPFAAPVQCSAAVIATASPMSAGFMPRGTAGCRRTCSTSGNARQAGMFTGLTVPATVSTGPALPIPRHDSEAHSGYAARSSTTEVTAAISTSADSRAGVGRCDRTTTRPSASTRAPAIFVPPMSSAPYTLTPNLSRTDRCARHTLPSL